MSVNMKRLATYILLLATGIAIGATVSWVNSWYPDRSYVRDKITLGDVLKYSNVLISDDNFSCEGDVKHDVGSVTGSIIELNNLHKRNMLSFGCYQNICTLSVSSCMPWQDQECGNRILKFDINAANEIDTASFTCLDIP